MLDFPDVQAAARNIAGKVHRTPVLSSQWIDEIAGAHVYFKCENLQKAGAFKSRGAVNTVFSLGDAEIRKGVATHSSGNHGAALARAASLRQCKAYIVVPQNAPAVKKAAIKAYGAEIILCEPTLDAREKALAEVVSRTGAAVVHPYDDERVIAGQGTATLELLEEVPGLDAVVVPVGGGGLLAGSSLVTREKDVALFAAEPIGADDAYRSVTSGERVTAHVPNTICEGLQTVLGELNFGLIQQAGLEVFLVDDQQTIEAMKLIWSRLKLVTEPSSAIALAAVIDHRDRFAGQQVGIVLTGGNVDLDRLPFQLSP